MDLLSVMHQVSFFADATAAGNAMRNFIGPTITTLCVIAGLVATGFLVHGGFQMITSSGQPDRLDHAKTTIRNAILGLIIVLSAASLTAILTNTYQNSTNKPVKEMPALTEVKPDEGGGGLVEVLINAVVGLLKNIVETVGKPFIDALQYFTKATPLMAENSSVFNLWLTIVAIADVLFILVVILLGFHVMSFSALGLEEIEFKHLLPQLIVVFLLMNSSIFAIDAIISLSNGMISAVQAGFASSTVWESLSKVMDESKDMKLAALLIYMVFIILSVVLLIYYILRLVVLYIGAVLSPIVAMLWLLPSFKDFASNAIRSYITVIFVLFVHVVILILASSIFAGMATNDPNKGLDPIMSMLVGVATVLALLKTQAVIQQMAYASAGARTARKLGGQFVNGVSHLSTKVRQSNTTTTTSSKATGSTTVAKDNPARSNSNKGSKS